MKKKIIVILVILLLGLSMDVFGDCSSLNDAEFYASFDVNCNTDNSDNGHTVTNNGASNVAGKLGNACDFELSETDYITANTVADTWVDTAGSISGWIKLESSPDLKFIAFSSNPGGAGSDDDFIASVMTSDNFLTEIGVPGSANAVTDSTNRNTDTDWHHIVVTWDGDSHVNKYYVDGVSIGSDSTYNNNLDDINRFTIGAIEWRTSYLGYMDGIIDEVGIYDYELTANNISDLYNSGDGCNPYGVPPSITINTPLVDNTNSSDNPFQFEFNGTVIDTNDIVNCSFVVNEAIEDSLINIAINNTNRLFNFSDGNGYYNMTVDCYNNESVFGNITVSNIFIDTVQPIIETNLTNNSVFLKNLGGSFYVNYSDTHLEAINFSIYRLNTGRVIDSLINNTFVDSITTDRYTLNFSDSFLNPNWLNGREYAVVVSAWDGHTDNALRYSPLVINNVLRYGGLSFYCDDTEEMNFIYLHDKIQPVIKFNTPRKQQKCYYETTGTFKKVDRPDYPVWYIDLENRFWIDEKDGNFESDLLYPHKLMIRLNFDRNTDFFISESFGDLNFNTQTYYFSIDAYTTYVGEEINITDLTVSGDAWQLASNFSFNATRQTEVLIKMALNSVKTISAGTSILYTNVTLDGSQIFQGSLRTMTGTYTGVSGFMQNVTITAGNHFIAVFYREDGVGDVQLSNIDTIGIGIDAQNEETVCTPIIDNQSVTFSSTSFIPRINFSLNNEYNTPTMTQHNFRVSATGITTTELYVQHIEDVENSTIIKRYISSATDLGNLFLPFVDDGVSSYKNYSIYTKNDNAETITVNAYTFGFCLNTINGTKINYVWGSNESSDFDNDITYTAGTHLITREEIILRNESNLFIEGSYTVQSLSGEQTPNIYIEVAGEKCTEKDRGLSSNDDIGNIFMYCISRNNTIGSSINIDTYITVPTGETLNLIDDITMAKEFTLIPLDFVNIPPSIAFTSDLSNVTNGIDTSIIVNGFDFNDDNINLNVTWFVNGVEINLQNGTIESGGFQSFVLSSGFYTTGQFINCTVTSDDSRVEGNTLFCTTREVQSATSSTDALLRTISDTLTEFLNLFEGIFMYIFEMIWIALFLILFLKYKNPLLFSASGLGFVFMFFRVALAGIEDTYDLVIMITSLVLAIGFTIFGVYFFFKGLDNSTGLHKEDKGLKRIWN